VTIAINTNQMNVTELLTEDDIGGTSMLSLHITKPIARWWSRRARMGCGTSQRLLRTAFNHISCLPTLDSSKRSSADQPRRLHRTVDLELRGDRRRFFGTHPADLIEFARRTPDGAVLTIEGLMRNVLPMNTIAIALGLHVRVGIEDNLWYKKGERITSVQQIEQAVRIARELNRDIATCDEARKIYRIGEYWRLGRRKLYRG
jgi:uncharacterized protein (DUF849 family)